MSKTIAWKCDGCGTVVTMEIYPPMWWIVGKERQGGEYGILSQIRHICNECQDKILRRT